VLHDIFIGFIGVEQYFYSQSTSLLVIRRSRDDQLYWWVDIFTMAIN